MFDIDNRGDIIPFCSYAIVVLYEACENNLFWPAVSAYDLSWFY